MNSKKLLSLIIIFIFLSVPIITLADDYIEEDNVYLNLDLETSSDFSRNPFNKC